MINIIKTLQKGYWKGVAAEVLAAWLLRLKGYRILKRRYRNSGGEIDLIARRRNLLVFVEVKYRSNFQKGLEAIQPYQRGRIENASQIYLSSCIMKSPKIHFDVIVVSGYGKIKHFPKVWRVGD
jgi:putative endonuclease